MKWPAVFRQIATENQVEVVEFPRLARSVYYTTQVNQQIPFQLYGPSPTF